MPTKTFITPFQGENKVYIAGNEKKEFTWLFIFPKNRAFHQAYISDF